MIRHQQSLIKDLLQNSSRSTKVLALTALGSLVFGLWGWYALRDTLNLNSGDIVYRSISALTLSVPYQSGSEWGYDWRIEIARWLGIIAVITGASKAGFALFENHWLRRKAKNQKGHWLVVGSAPFAAQLSKSAITAKYTVHWLSAGADHSANKQLLVDQSPWSLGSALAFGLEKAAGVVVATNDDATTGAIAREIRASYPDENKLSVLASIRSPWLAMRIDEIEGVPGISVFSEAQIAIRHLQRRLPPFLIAESLKQRRIHMVIVDFTDYGEAVLIETLLSSLTTRLTKPLFTIVDPHADYIKQDLMNRYPDLSKSADLNFVCGSLTAYQNLLGADEFIAAVERAPVTAFYSCHSDDEVSLVTAIALQSIMRKQAGIVPSIFTRQAKKQGLPLVSSDIGKLRPGELVGFGSLKDIASEFGLFSNQADLLAREFHSAYVAAANDEKSAKIPWEELTEDMRDANRRLVVHIPAKLYCLGFDVQTWLIHVDRHPGSIRLPSVPGASKRTELIEELAILEHERWMADRRINGWTYGPTRDNVRRIHPDLVDFSELVEESKNYDRTMVRSLLSMIDSEI